jgi:hypothetical protein
MEQINIPEEARRELNPKPEWFIVEPVSMSHNTMDRVRAAFPGARLVATGRRTEHDAIVDAGLAFPVRGKMDIIALTEQLKQGGIFIEGNKYRGADSIDEKAADDAEAALADFAANVDREEDDIRVLKP